MNDSNTIDNWFAALVILGYVIWFLYQTSKGDKDGHA